MTRDIHLIDEHSSLENYKLSMSLIVPRPIAWIATFNQDGSVNLAPYALFSVVCTDPMMLQFSSRSPKDSYHNAKREGAFTVHIATVDQKPQVALTSKEFPEGESEADAAGMTWTKAPNVNAPILDDALVAFECEVHSFVDLETSVLTIGRVKAIHTDPSIMAQDGMADFAKLNPLSKLGRQQWGKTEDFV
ncbi:MAG: flavin reductase family protein [Actinomycetaceae bacterium]|nr:flavin reductase family protein [Actinomycetaceae bacterium]